MFLGISCLGTIQYKQDGIIISMESASYQSRTNIALIINWEYGYICLEIDLAVTLWVVHDLGPSEGPATRQDLNFDINIHKSWFISILFPNKDRLCMHNFLGGSRIRTLDPPQRLGGSKWRVTARSTPQARNCINYSLSVYKIAKLSK